MQKEINHAEYDHIEHAHTEHDHTEHAHAEHDHAEHDHAGHHHAEGMHGAQETPHSHEHNHPNAKAVSNRLARAIGHLESVKGMVDRGEDCTQVLIQLAAVRSAINNAGKVLLADHINHCMIDAVENKDYDKIAELNDAIQKFVK